jgi:N-acetyl-gamma-glutamyl-phosphate reductase
VKEFAKWYGMEHSCPEILAEAVYGLAEINREAIKKARVVGLAGCYPTSVQLGLAHFAFTKVDGGKQLIDGEHIISDSKSGTSGAGRRLKSALCCLKQAITSKAYGVKGHRHLPEIVQGLKAIAGTIKLV